MPNPRERSCSEKEVQAIRYNHNEKRCLEKKIIGLKQEGACSIQLINQTHKNIKVSYKHLKHKVSKIKTNLTVKEIEEFRRLEEEGKIKLFKSIAKPDSANRILTYAKRLNIDYECHPRTNAKHSDDLVNISSFSEEELTRKDILLRQISEMNDRFNAAVEKERKLERNIFTLREVGVMSRVVRSRNKSDSDYETDSEGVNTMGPKKDILYRPSTAFEFSETNSIKEFERPSTSIGSIKYEKSILASKIVRSKSVKVKPIKDTEWTKDFNQQSNPKEGGKQTAVRRSKSLKHDSKSPMQNVSGGELPRPDNNHGELPRPDKNQEQTFKTDINIDDTTEIFDIDIESSSENTPRPSSKLKRNVVKPLGHSQSLKETRTKSLKKETTGNSSNLKHSKSTNVNSSLNETKTNCLNMKNRQTSKPATSVGPLNSTPRSIQTRTRSASSLKRREVWANLVATRNCPQRAPFDCHAAAEKEEKEMFSSTGKNKVEEGRTKFLSRDSIESNLGQDLQEELRKELLREEEKKAIQIEDKICNFMDRLNEKVKSEKQEQGLENKHFLSLEKVMTERLESHREKPVNLNRQNTLFKEQNKRVEQNRLKNAPSSLKDVNKSRHLRTGESVACEAFV